MNLIYRVLKYFAVEVFIVVLLIFTINSYVGVVEEHIKSDGVGYYDYLPSIFIHHDIIRKDKSYKEFSAIYKRVDLVDGYVGFNDRLINKYACGTALLQLPFFGFASVFADADNNEATGYELVFHKAIYFAALLYLFLALLFLKELLLLYGIKRSIVILIQILLVFSTSVINYVNHDASFSHIYSMFAITAFLYFTKLYFQNHKNRDFFLGSLFFGLVLILRQVNIIVILFVPFIAGSAILSKEGLLSIFKKKIYLLLGLGLCFGIFSIQIILWYVQTGSFFVYSYQNEGFDFSHPHFIDILLSYRKGLLVYTPIIIISLLSVLWMGYKKRYYWMISWVIPFVLITYVLSSWWSWYYGCSYGLRAYVDFYALFFIPIALLLNELTPKIRFVIIGISLLTIPLNVIQTYQYKEYIIHWINMDKEKYWKVFLKTDDKFKGLVWKTRIDVNNYLVLKEIEIADIKTDRDTVISIVQINSLEINKFNNSSDALTFYFSL